MTSIRRATVAFLVPAALAAGCSSGRVSAGPNMATEAAVRRNEDAFGPEPTGIDQIQNPPTGVAVAIGQGEVTRPRERNTPVPVATPTGQPAAQVDGGVDGGAGDAGTAGTAAPR